MSDSNIVFLVLGMTFLIDERKTCVKCLISAQDSYILYVYVRKIKYMILYYCVHFFISFIYVGMITKGNKMETR